MSLKPSKYLLEEFKKECREKCQQCLWGTQPSVITTQWKRNCIQNCVQETIEIERPLLNYKLNGN